VKGGKIFGERSRGIRELASRSSRSVREGMEVYLNKFKMR